MILTSLLIISSKTATTSNDNTKLKVTSSDINLAKFSVDYGTVYEYKQQLYPPITWTNNVCSLRFQLIPFLSVVIIVPDQIWHYTYTSLTQWDSEMFTDMPLPLPFRFICDYDMCSIMNEAIIMVGLYLWSFCHLLSPMLLLLIRVDTPSLAISR